MTPAKKTRRRAGERPAAAAAAPAKFAVADLPLGRTGKHHPGVGLGLWALGRWTLEDEARTKATIGRAVERGIPWYDTAEVYGNGRSARLLGDVLARAGAAAGVPFIGTKVSWEHLRPAQVRAALVGSLQRLNRTSVDLYLVHAPDPHVPIRETMGMLETLWKEGRVGAIGVSNFSLEQMEEAERALSEAEVAVNQVRYNLLDRRDGEEILQHCRERGIVVEAYTPLARGLLAGRYLDSQRPPLEVARFAHGVVEGDRFAAVASRARALAEFARHEKVSPASLALHWLRRQGAAPVFGASVPGQVDEIVAALAEHPSDAALDRAEELTRGALE